MGLRGLEARDGPRRAGRLVMGGGAELPFVQADPMARTRVITTKQTRSPPVRIGASYPRRLSGAMGKRTMHLS